MNSASFTGSNFSAILSGIAAVCFAIVSYWHYSDGDRSQGLLFLMLALSQFCLCMNNLRRLKKANTAERDRQEGEDK